VGAATRLHKKEVENAAGAQYNTPRTRKFKPGF